MGNTTEQAAPPSLAQGAPGPCARLYLHVTYVLCAHVAWQGGHVVLAKAQRAAVIHCVGGSVRALPPLCPHPGPSMGAVSPKAMVSLTQQHGKAHAAQRRRVQHPPGREDRVGTPYKWQRQRGGDTAWLGYSGVGTSSYHGASRPRGASGQWDPRLGASGWHQSPGPLWEAGRGVSGISQDGGAQPDSALGTHCTGGAPALVGAAGCGCPR